mmetsp:Transcript_23854/g.59237  ORF Transcript_23854/g.59237 Transcript_23854/m.59237 type:complete len:345 (-) Transcript_23854:209-1243(-)
MRPRVRRAARAEVLGEAGGLGHLQVGLQVEALEVLAPNRADRRAQAQVGERTLQAEACGAGGQLVVVVLLAEDRADVLECVVHRQRVGEDIGEHCAERAGLDEEQHEQVAARVSRLDDQLVLADAELGGGERERPVLVLVLGGDAVPRLRLLLVREPHAVEGDLRVQRPSVVPFARGVGDEAAEGELPPERLLKHAEMLLPLLRRDVKVEHVLLGRLEARDLPRVRTRQVPRPEHRLVRVPARRRLPHGREERVEQRRAAALARVRVRPPAVQRDADAVPVLPHVALVALHHRAYVLIPLAHAARVRLGAERLRGRRPRVEVGGPRDRPAHRLDAARVALGARL